MKSPPNILLVMCDQMAPQFTGPYGNRSAITPTLDRMAADGTVFDAAYTSCPLCAPARHSFMTGRYASRTGCFDNSSPLGADQPTFAHYLTNAGYETVLSGKMHFPGPDQLHGFASRLTTDIYPSDFTWLPNRPKEGWSSHANVHANPIAIDYVSAGPRQWTMQLEFDEETHFRALEFLRGRAREYGRTAQREHGARPDKPFFLCVSYSHPHEPFQPTHELWDRYADVEIPLPADPPSGTAHEHPIDTILNDYHGVSQVELTDPDKQYAMRRAYLAQVSYIDDKLADLLKTLDQCGLADDTIVLFTSDHGDMLGERGMVQKRCHYEYSARIPLLMRFPATLNSRAAGSGPKSGGSAPDLTRIPPGARVPEPVSIVDLAPTIMELAGAEPPSAPMDGSSLVSLIKGRRQPDRMVFCESHAAGMTTTTFMARRGNLKYIHATGYQPQLYDLESDPGEWHNIAGHPETQDLESELVSSIRAQFDEDQIEKQVEESIARRRVIRRAMKTAGSPSWDHQPFFDATRRYWREG